MIFLQQYSHIKTLQALAKKRKQQVFLVGGFLRDFMLGRVCHDFDFAVQEDAIPLARAFARKVKGAFVLLDKERHCARVAKKEHDRILTFDFADYRAPTLRQDLIHRDFTINTLIVNLNECDEQTVLPQAIIGSRKALSDIRDKHIRMTTVKTFSEDPLRILRAFSLRAALQFQIEPLTRRQIKKDKNLLQQVSYERVRDELFKILDTNRAARCLKELDRMKILEVIIPQVRVMANVQQGTYHHLDVWPHSLETVVQLEKLYRNIIDIPDMKPYLMESLGGTRTRWALMKLGALLHDIGKPEAKRKQDYRTLFHGHERIGKGIVNYIARMLKLSTKERFALMDMVLWHLRPGYLSNMKCPSAKSIFRYFRDTKEEAVSIALIAMADQKSTCGPLTTEMDQKHHEEICWRLVHAYFEHQRQVPFVRLITGNDLIKELKLSPSPLFAKILQNVEEQQTLGNLKSVEDALELARKIAYRY